MTTPPIRYADLLDYAKARPDLIKHVGESPGPVMLIYPRYRRLAMDLGCVVRIVLSASQRYLPIALFGSAKWLSLLYPKPALVLQGPHGGIG